MAKKNAKGKKPVRGAVAGRHERSTFEQRAYAVIKRAIAFIVITWVHTKITPLDPGDIVMNDVVHTFVDFFFGAAEVALALDVLWLFRPFQDE